MALGVPTVVHDTAALRELGDEALLFADATDPAALAATLERALGDRALRARLMTAGRQRAARYRWRECAEAHAALYREVAAS